MPDFLQQLKQRHVVRAALIYAAAVWALAQGIAQLSPVFGLSAKVTLWFVIACVIGFPFWIAFAWFFRFTPHGIAREDEAMTDTAASRRTGRHLDYWIIGILAVAVVLLLTNQLVLQRGKTIHEFAATTSTPAVLASVPIPAKSVAVLPFENLSASKANAYFADGIQDLILTKLADIGDLKVIARTSTESYGAHPANLTLVGKQLGVATILEGSVQKAGKQVLINVQLIDARTDSHVWAKSYTRTLTNIFGVEGEVAEKVAAALDAKLTAQETASVQHLPTTNPQAYTLYLKAQYEATQFYKYTANPDQLRKAAHYLTEAIAHDPKFALAYAELALVQGDIAGNHFKGSTGLHDASLANARKAVALQPNLPEVHSALGLALMQSSPTQSLDEFQTALRLGPNSSEAQTGVAVWYIHYGHWQQAAAQLAQLLRLDPRSSWAHGHLARVDMALRHYADARQILVQGLAIDPHNTTLIELMAALAPQQGQVRRARQWIVRLPDQLAFKPRAMAFYDLLLRNNAQALQWATRSPPSTRYDDAGARELLIARAALAAGDAKLVAPALAKARAAIMAALQKHPDVIGLHGRLAIIETLRGHRAAALRSADKAIALLASWPGARLFGAGYDNLTGPGVKAAVLAHFGDAKAACAILDKLLATPGTGANISPTLLRLDPTWDPIRKAPAFHALLKKYGTTATANASIAVPATTR